MYISLDLEADKPIYSQLIEQIIAGIAKKEILPGERLPSVRSMAKDIGINLHTVNKAYQQLKRDGFILIHRQRGVVVNPEGTPKAGKLYFAQLNEALDPLIAEAICRDVSEADFLKLCTKLYSHYQTKDGDEI